MTRTGLPLDADEHSHRMDVARAIYEDCGSVRLGRFRVLACLSTSAARAWIDKCVESGELLRIPAEPYPRHVFPEDDTELPGGGRFSHVIRRAETAPRVEITGAVSVWDYADAMRCATD